MRGGAQIVARGGHHRAEPLEDFQFQPQRAVAGVGDPGFDLAEFGGGEADLAGQRLAMDEGRIQRRGHQLVAVLRRHLDEIAEHIVVADLEALDAGVVGIARLHRGDHEARGVAQIAGFVERALIAFADKAAVALDQRQLFGQRAFEFARQLARRLAQRRHDRNDILRRLVELRQPRQRLVGGEDAVAQAGEIARAAAPDRQPRQRARHVGRGAQRGADIVARGGVGHEGADRIEPARDRGAVGQRRGEPLCQQARSGRGHRAVDRVEQRAAPFAGQRARQFEIGAGGGVDRHGGAGGLARRRRQRRALSDLGAVDIGDGGGGGGRFQPRHRAEAVHGRDREIIAQPPLGGGAVEKSRVSGVTAGNSRNSAPSSAIAIQRVGDDHFIGVDARQRRRQFAGRTFRDHEFGGRNIDPGQPDAVAAGGRARPRDRQQIIVGPGVEQRVFGQRARRHQPHHAAAHHALVAAGARFCRVLGLLAHRDAMARPRSAGAGNPRSARPARRTSGYPRPDACRAWSARCRAFWRRFRRPRRTARRNRPSGRTAAARDGRP